MSNHSQDQSTQGYERTSHESHRNCCPCCSPVLYSVQLSNRMGTRGSFHGVKRSECEPDHSCASGAKAMNGADIYRIFMALCLAKHTVDFALPSHRAASCACRLCTLCFCNLPAVLEPSGRRTEAGMSLCCICRCEEQCLQLCVLPASQSFLTLFTVRS
jgi:hypothetical protein